METDPLDALMESVKPPTKAPPKEQAIAKVSYTHDGMIDLLLANPAMSQQDLAAYFGYTPPWICRILASDAFRARYSERAKELIDPTLLASIEERFKGLVLRSIEILEEKLAKPSDEVPDQLALQSLNVAAKAAGFGIKNPQPAPAAPGDIHIHLEQMGGGLVNLLRKKKAEALEGDFHEVASG